MRERKIEQMNMSLAMRRDGSLHTEEQRTKYGSPLILQSLRTLENYDIIYDKGQLRTRKGFEQYTSVALPGTPKQLFYHTIFSRDEEFIFAICNTTIVIDDVPVTADRWYRVIANTEHDLIIDEAATSLDDGYRKPILSWGDRVFFGTDSGWYWTDRERLYDGTKWYHAGIQKPDDTLIVKQVEAPGQDVTEGAFTTVLNTTTHRRIAFKMVLDKPITIDTITLYLKRTVIATNESHVKVGLYTDSSGSPSDTLANEYAQSDWLAMYMIGIQEDWVGFLLKQSVDIPAGTYWIVLEGDTSYYASYISAVGADHYVYAYYLSLDYQATNYIVKYYDWDSSTWGLLADSVGCFFIGGIVTSAYYDYVYTLYNSMYSIESRPSAFTRTQISEWGKVIEVISPTADDDQVDKYRVYRRVLSNAQGIDTPEDEIIDVYRYVGEADIGDDFQDFRSQSGLGAELQTDDHYCLRDTDDTNMNLRGAIVPIGAVIWKGRVWVWVKDSNKLYFSKRLSENGASGQQGDMIPDFFPLENELEIEYPSAILNARPLSGDQLAIYFRNGSIWILWGMDEPANPPDDYALREMITTIGLTASGGLTEFRGSHIYLARQGLYRFMGGPTPEFLSEFVQSILNGINDTNIIETRLITNGEEMWILVDEDNDGYKEVVYLLDMQKSVPTWRRYNYGVNIADFVVKTLGTEQRTILAADATNNHIIELQVGTTDEGKPIDSYLETHQVRISQARFSMIEIYASYSDVAQFCDVTLYDHLDNEFNYQINPISSDDARGHKTGLRAYSKSTFRLKLAQSTVEETELLGFLLSYTED